MADQEVVDQIVRLNLSQTFTDELRTEVLKRLHQADGVGLPIWYIVYSPSVERDLLNFLSKFLPINKVYPTSPFRFWSTTALPYTEIGIVRASQLGKYLFELGHHKAIGGFNSWTRQQQTVLIVKDSEG